MADRANEPFEGTVPTVLDRFIQQALLQVLQPLFDPTFSDASYGFRPGRSAHDAVLGAKAYVQEGRSFVVDIDLEKFFDRVNHDVLMGKLVKRITDRRVLRLIRRYLTAGVMANGVVMERDEGTPQGGPLSPLLANLLLDEVDLELTRFRRRCWGERKKEVPNAKKPSTIPAGVSAPTHRVGARGAPHRPLGAR